MSTSGLAGINLPKMNKRVKTKWLKALRSGEYVQGQDQLVTIPTERGKVTSLYGDAVRDVPKNNPEAYAFCCLGVLENLMHEEHGTTFKANTTKAEQLAGFEPWQAGFHSKQCAKWSGLQSFDDETEDDPHQIAEEIASMNDMGWSFKKIARWIERRL